MIGDCDHDKRFHLMGAINGCCACELEMTKGQVEGAAIRIVDLEAEVERLTKYHSILATVCRRMKGPCICGCHTGTTTMEEETP